MSKLIHAVISLFMVLLVSHDTAAHSYLSGDCCRQRHSDCDARPAHPYPLCRMGHRITDQYSRWWLPRCWGVGCMGGLPGCLPEISDDAQCGDTDQDSIPDYFERNAFDPYPYDDDESVLNLASAGAHAERKDIFIEVDCLVSDGNGNGSYSDAVDHSHCPLQNAIEQVVTAFANAPVANPDGTTGVQLHVDTGALYGAGVIHTVAGTGGVSGTYGDLRDRVDGVLTGGGDQIDESGNEIIDWDGNAGDPATNFYTLKGDHFQRQLRQSVYRYTVFGHQCNARRPANDCTSGWGETPGNDFMVTLGGTRADGTDCWDTDTNGFSVGNVDEQAGTLMHELGHTLSLEHGGQDGVNFKPNYLSVMRYGWQSCGVPASPLGIIPGGCDYSRIACTTLDETDLDECIGRDCGLGFGPLDWNGMNGIEGNSCNPPNISWDINNDGRCVSPGVNGVLEALTIVNANDFLVVVDQWILDGANRCCNSSATGNDEQVKAVGECQHPDELDSFEDWNALLYAFQALETYADGVSGRTPIDATPELIEQDRRYLSQQSAPALQLSKKVAPNTVPGSATSYAVTVKNTGRGPALNVVITDTLPDGSSARSELPVVIAGSEVTTTVTFDTSADHHFCDALSNSLRVDYVDMAGYRKEVTYTLQPAYEYAAHLVCGRQKPTEYARIAPGFYATTVNVHNPNRSDVTFCKKLALSYPPGKQLPGQILPIALDTLKPDQALAVDCPDIESRVFPDGHDASYLEGFVVIQSTDSLDVTAMYSTAAVDREGNPTDHSSLEIKDVSERPMTSDRVADLGIEKEVNTLHSYTSGNTTFKAIQYSLFISNEGPSAASNITVADELQLAGGALEVSEEHFEATHGGRWQLAGSTPTTARLNGTIPNLAASETATLKFVVSIAIVSQNELQAVLENTARVYSDTPDPVTSNNSHSVVTQEP